MENREFRESEHKPKASIRLEFFRHDDKAKAVEGQTDETVRLTPKGRVGATEAGKNRNPEPEVAMAFGSSRERSVETAMRQMFTNENIGADDTLEDIRELVSGDLKVGKKDAASPNLNFDWTSTKEFTDVAMPRYTNSKDALKFLMEDSDQLVQQLKDKKSSSFSRTAGNIAELVKKYWEVLPTWERVASEHPEKYQQYQNEMQRFMGSHQTVTESFLMKVIDKTQGHEAVMKFIESLPDKNGFGFSEGFSVNLAATDAGNTMTLKYKDQEWALTPELIDEIIKDKVDLNKSIE